MTSNSGDFRKRRITGNVTVTVVPEFSQASPVPEESNREHVSDEPSKMILEQVAGVIGNLPGKHGWKNFRDYHMAVRNFLLRTEPVVIPIY